MPRRCRATSAPASGHVHSELLHAAHGGGCRVQCLSWTASAVSAETCAGVSSGASATHTFQLGVPKLRVSICSGASHRQNGCNPVSSGSWCNQGLCPVHWGRQGPPCQSSHWTQSRLQPRNVAAEVWGLPPMPSNRDSTVMPSSGSLPFSWAACGKLQQSDGDQHCMIWMLAYACSGVKAGPAQDCPQVQAWQESR